MNPYKQLILEYERFLKEGKNYPLGGFSAVQKPAINEDAPKALIFAPHPDDETITGALPLRLMRQAGWRIIDVAVTLGSKKERRLPRLQELKNCCGYLGFDVEVAGEEGLEKVNIATRSNAPDLWQKMVNVIAQILQKHKPKAVFFPHKDDWNTTHIGTHYLVYDALKSLNSDFSCYTVETEYWGAMYNPNLMVEIDSDYATDILCALTYHIGEVSRNPYHLRLPAYFVDNARRGSELVGGQGAEDPGYIFATLYRTRKWVNGEWINAFEGGRFLAMKENPASLFV